MAYAVNIKLINAAVNALCSRDDQQMSFASRLKIQNIGMFSASMFYVIAGIVLLIALLVTGFPPHIGIIAIFSLATAYGLFKKRSWTIYFIFIIFFTVTAFAVYTLYSYFLQNALFTTAILVYLALTWIFTAYTASKRNTLED